MSQIGSPTDGPTQTRPCGLLYSSGQKTLIAVRAVIILVEGTSILLHRYQSRYSRLTSLILVTLSAGYGLPYRYFSRHNRSQYNLS
jgi:hypothetical protein